MRKSKPPQRSTGRNPSRSPEASSAAMKDPQSEHETPVRSHCQRKRVHSNAKCMMGLGLNTAESLYGPEADRAGMLLPSGRAARVAGFLWSFEVDGAPRPLILGRLAS